MGGRRSNRVEDESNFSQVVGARCPPGPPQHTHPETQTHIDTHDWSHYLQVVTAAAHDAV